MLELCDGVAIHVLYYRYSHACLSVSVCGAADCVREQSEQYPMLQRIAASLPTSYHAHQLEAKRLQQRSMDFAKSSPSMHTGICTECGLGVV